MSNGLATDRKQLALLMSASKHLDRKGCILHCLGFHATVTRSVTNMEIRMLILTRRLNETVMIGDDVTVTVLGVKGGQVRIGVNAPKDVAVHREEVYERIKHEQLSAAPVAAAS